MTSARGAAIEVIYIADEAEPVTVDFDRVDAGRVVRGRPVRIPVSRAGQRNYSGLYWSSTTQAHPVYESLLERNRLLLADFCPPVEWMAAQSFWMRGYDGSTLRRHVSDLLLQHRNGAFTVVDVKHQPSIDYQQRRIIADDPRRLVLALTRAGASSRAMSPAEFGDVVCRYWEHFTGGDIRYAAFPYTLRAEEPADWHRKRSRIRWRGRRDL